MTLSFDLHWLRDGFNLTLEGRIEAGVTGLFGPSGAGKTSLLHLIAGIAKPDRGRIDWNGDILLDTDSGCFQPPHTRHIGLMFQGGRLFPHMSVARNLRFGEAYRQASARRFNFAEIVDLLELAHLLDKRPNELSGGEVQRVALGRAILGSPRLLLLDEPLSSLDRGMKRQILPYLRKVGELLGIPMVYVSHDLAEILQLTDRLLILNRGQIVANGQLAEIVQRQRALELIHDLSLINIVGLKVRRHQPEEGITQLDLVRPDAEAPGSEAWVAPLLEARTGDILTVALRPEDIALVKRPVTEISIQNQLPARVVGVQVTRYRAVCVVDVGIPLLAEITPHAVHQLDLRADSRVWCLFKAHALRILD